MLDIFKGILSMQVPFNMIVLIVMFGCMAGVITAIAAEIRKYVCHRQDIDFKRELVDRGLSGEEIERIVSARTPDNSGPVTTIGGNYFAAGGPAAST